MTLHGTALWLHVVLAIMLVGGSAWAHVAGTRVRTAESVAEARAHVEGLRVFVAASTPLAVGTLVAGAYLATVGSMWTAPWLVTSLVLFAVVGALSGSQVEPAAKQLVAALDEAPPGPVPSEVRRRMHAPGASTIPAVFAGVDLALVFLMTNKPGLALSVSIAAIGLVIGLVLAARERPRPTAVAAG